MKSEKTITDETKLSHAISQMFAYDEFIRLVIELKSLAIFEE